MRIELFHKQDCPFSARVREFIDEKHLRNQIEFHDVDEGKSTRARLVGLAGKEQVPCLVLDGEPILESEDIMQWLDTNLAHRDSSVAA
jgi:glutathione S-transferase